MQVDDREQLAAVWLVDGPGPEAAWPLSLDGRYAEHRGEWYFPKGTRVDAIVRAAGRRRGQATTVTSANGARGAGADGLFDPLVEEVDERGVEVDAEDSPRMQAVARAVKAWTDQLIDRSARNNLLFFRDQRAGTLDLTDAPPRPVFDILAGRSRHLAQLFPADEDALADAARRSRTIHNKAQAIYEERGIHTLYLACGLATWDNQHGTAEPAAPILLAPATLTARGAAQQNFDLQVTGELEVNPTLLNALAAEFDVRVRPRGAAGQRRHGRRDRHPGGARDRLSRGWLSKARQVPGFSVRPKTVLGNFSYAKLPMVRDLQGSVDALADARPDRRPRRRRRRPPGRPRPPRRRRHRRCRIETPPADEFLVLDADSSQNYAINKVLGGPGPRHQGAARHRQEPDDQQPHRLPGRARQDGAVRRREARGDRRRPQAPRAGRPATTSSSTCTAASRASGRSHSRSPRRCTPTRRSPQPDLVARASASRGAAPRAQRLERCAARDARAVGTVAVRRRGAAARARRGSRDRGAVARARSCTR